MFFPQPFPAAGRRPSTTFALSWSVVCAVFWGSSQSFAQEPTAPPPMTRPNVLFIAVDDLRCDLGAYGVPHAKTPEIDALAATARVFTRHYVQVPTCGASRCALLRGKYPDKPAHVGNDAVKNTQAEWAAVSLPATFRNNGYRTWSLGKIGHYPGNRTGQNWADGPEELPGVWDRSWIPDGPWKTPKDVMHGYADGQPRQPGKSLPFQSHDGPDAAFPDAWVARDAEAALRDLAKTDQPWFFCVGFFKPHLPFAAPKRWHDLHAAGVPALSAEASQKPAWPSGWHASGEFRGNYGHPLDPLTQRKLDPNQNAAYAQQLRQAYAGSVSYMDAQVGRVLRALRETGLEQNTVVVLWSDHGFLLGEHGIWGKHCLYEEALRSPLMIRYPGLPHPGKPTAAVVETIDLFPTLLDLCNLPTQPSPTRPLHGRSLRPQLLDPQHLTSKPAVSFFSNGQRTLRTNRWRLICQTPASGVPTRFELFDYDSEFSETQNLFSTNADVVRDLTERLTHLPKPTSSPSGKPTSPVP